MFLFLIQLDDWQAVDTKRGGDFAAMMDVMFEHSPDDRLERNSGSYLSRQTRRIQPHLGVWLERRLDHARVTRTVRLFQRCDDPLKIGRGQVGKRLLDQLSGLLQSGDEFFRRVVWVHIRLTDTQSP
jgi:hypothetical protein